MKWRVIPLHTDGAFSNMALDEAVGDAVARGESPATIRFWRWQPSAVTIGRFQSLHDEIDVARCRELGVDWTRRVTGGGAVYHDYDGEITYSIIAPESAFPKGIIESYHVICGYVVNALRQLGFADATFVPINDIIVAGKKISGNAQTRRSGIVHQHGTVLFDVDVSKMFSLLKVPDEKIRDKMIAAVQDRVTSVVKQNPKISRDDVYKAMLAAFTADKDWEFGQLSGAELERAGELAASKYSSDEWREKR
jgi:lipoate-protein ligase A